MKKTLLITLFALLGLSQAAAQEYEYVPFVREGVKWVYFYNNYDDTYPANPHLAIGTVYLNLEFKGDTVIDGKTFKAMHKYYGDHINTENDTIPIYMREEDKIVYGIVPDGKTYRDCPIGNCVSEDDDKALYNGQEFVLYDFNDPITYWDNIASQSGLTSLFPNCYQYSDTIAIGNHLAKRYVGELWSEFRMIESIGMDGPTSYTLSFLMPMAIGGGVTFNLSHVIEDGEIIYKGWYYKDPEAAEYVPFVRGGAKWVYYCDNPFGDEVLNMPSGIHYYSFEFDEDYKVINAKPYMPVVLKAYNGNGEPIAQDFTPAYVREENKVVYAILPGGEWYPQCPVGIGEYVGYYGTSSFLATDEEFVLYDFNDPIELYNDLFPPILWDDDEYIPQIVYENTDTINISGHQSKCHHYRTLNNEGDMIIEGIGYDGYTGFPLFYFEKLITGFQVGYYLSHVVENGQIIYQGIHYNPDIHVGIDEVVAEQPRRPLDNNYYNLMGQPVGKEVPTAPGIYIHHGQKICVSRTR